MHITKRQEQFSQSLVVAVASCAGCAVGSWTVDDDSIDVTLRSKVFARKPKIDLQLKCMMQDIFHGDQIHFGLPIKNYDDLRTLDVCAPRILVLVHTPDQIEQWIEQDENAMSLHNCAYWLNLRGAPEANVANKTVHIPRINIFTPAALTAMMEATNANGVI